MESPCLVAHALSEPRYLARSARRRPAQKQWATIPLLHGATQGAAPADSLLDVGVDGYVCWRKRVLSAGVLEIFTSLGKLSRSPLSGATVAARPGCQVTDSNSVQSEMQGWLIHPCNPAKRMKAGPWAKLIDYVDREHGENLRKLETP